jgi:hypothetical protein
MSHNLDQCLSELEDAANKAEQEQLATIRKGAMETLRGMIFTLSPVDTGFYRASHDLEVNGISKFRRRRTKEQKGWSRKKFRNETNRMMAEAQGQMAKAADRLNAIHHIADLERITIANNAPHVHLVEGGISKKAPGGVYSIAERKATQIFSRVSVK